jgi:hypothetical protein
MICNDRKSIDIIDIPGTERECPEDNGLDSNLNLHADNYCENGSCLASCRFS